MPRFASTTTYSVSSSRTSRAHGSTGRPRPGRGSSRRGAPAGQPFARGHDVRAARVQEPAERDGPCRSSRTTSAPLTWRFVVDDIKAKKAELEAKGIPFNSAVNAVDEGVLAGWRWVYFDDPDGYPLELVEVAYYNADERREGIAAYLASRS